ncbi:ribonuclease H-like domain-containing protein [Tanacetum coccineum]
MSVHNFKHNSPNNSHHDDDIHDSITRISKLDISDPFHLHPNDTTALTIISIKLKRTENYQVWSCAMLLALEGFKKHNQLLKLMQFLMGLDDSYMQIKSSILSRETFPDVRSAYATISSKESHRVAVGSIRSNQNFNAGPSRPNNVNNNRQSGGSGLNNNRPSEGTGLVCENCGFNGHTMDRCFKIIGYLADFGKKNSGQNFKKQSVSNNNSVGKCSSSGFTDEQRLLLSLSSKTIKLKKMCRPIWQHMTYTDKELDNVIDISYLKIKVGHPNGTEAYISKIGNLRLSNGLTLYDVMVILEYYVTLISVHKLIKENKVIVAFDENRCYFLNQDLNLKKMLDWLGHPADPVLNVLKDSLNIDKKDNTICCEICQRAKQTREYFPLSDHKSKSLGDLVHLDLWGPYKVTSSEGFRYFLTVVDNYTRAVWVYLIKSKDEVSHFITVFYNLIENQYKRKIKVFRSDNGGIPLKMWTERVANDLNKNKSDSSSSSVSGSNINTANFPVNNSENDADNSDELVATQNEEVPTLEENIVYEGSLDQIPISSHGAQNVRRSSRQSVFPKNYNDFVVESKVKYSLEKYEMDAFLRNGTWEIVELTEGRKSIGSKWIYKIKFKSSGEIDRYKARFVAQGFGQQEGIDYEETISPVVKMVTDRCLLNIVMFMFWLVFQLDVNNAFLYGDLEEVVYIKAPEEYFPSDNKVCRLKMSLYGLKQAPRQWNAKLTSTLIENGFSQSICLNQRKYVLDLLSEYGMLACKPAKTPLMSKLVISNEASENDHLLENITDYQKLMGKLIYLTNTRPDISYDLHCLSQFMQQSTSLGNRIAFSTSGMVLSIRRTKLTQSYLEMCICLKDHLEAQERKQHTSTLKNALDFEDEILDAEVQKNKATPLSDEEIALDDVSQGTMASGSGGEEQDFDFDLTNYGIDD